MIFLDVGKQRFYTGRAFAVGDENGRITNIKRTTAFEQNAIRLMTFSGTPKMHTFPLISTSNHKHTKETL